MKREALSGQEVALNDDALMPLIDDMLKQRRAMCDELNEMFGLNVSVDYGSTWHSNVVEKQLIGQSELDANTDGSEELAGDESALPDDKDPNAVDEAGASGDDVSRLNTDGEEKPDDTDGEDAPADDDVDNVDERDADSETDRSDTDTAEHDNNTDDSEKPDDSENDESDSEECVKDQPEEEQTEEENPEEEKPEDEKSEDEKSEEEKPEGDKKKKGEDEDET